MREFRYNWNEEITRWLKNIEWCTSEIWGTRAENWEWTSLLKWWAPDNRTENTLEYILMGEKKILTIETITRGWQQARITNLEENGARLREKSSSVFKCREWGSATQALIADALRNENYKGWTNNEKNLKDLGERHLTDDKSFLRQTSKRNLRIAPEK